MTAHVALVAGGSRGLGLLICRDLLARGFAVVACARDADELSGAEAQLDGAGPVLHPRVRRERRRRGAVGSLGR